MSDAGPPYPLRAVVVVAVGVLALHVAFATPTGDLNSHFTDHLRHLCESQALVANGGVIYRQPYDEFSRDLLPCPAHAGLFGERTAPYPPLGVLLHWPLGRIERAGWLAPATVHRLTALSWLAFGALAAALALWLAWPRRELVAGVLLVLTPLALGSGANGFYDTTFLAAGAAALVFLVRGRPEWAVMLLGLAAALHFRALVFAPVGLWAALEAWKGPRRPAVIALGVAGVLTASAAWAAFALRGTLDTIPAHNPVHFEHLVRGSAKAVEFFVLALLVAGWLWRSRARWTALTILAAVGVALSDRSHGYYHALVMLVPPLVLSAERREPGKALPLITWAWCYVSVLLAFRYQWSAFYQWLIDASRGQVS